MATIIKCGTCGKEYSLNAKNCIHCGELNPTKLHWYNKRGLAILLIFLLWPIGLYAMWKGKHWPLWVRWSITLLFVGTIFFAYVANYEKPHGQKGKSAVSDLNTRAVYLGSILLANDLDVKLHDGEGSSIDIHQTFGIKDSVKAVTILHDFAENEVAGAKKYEGEWVVTGKVESISNTWGQALISLGNRGFSSFNAEIYDKEKAANYRKGQSVKFYCRNIREIATFVYGECQDYNDWAPKKSSQLIRQAVTKGDDSVSKEDAIFKILYELSAKIQLPVDTPCYKEALGKACISQLAKGTKQVLETNLELAERLEIIKQN